MRSSIICMMGDSAAQKSSGICVVECLNESEYGSIQQNDFSTHLGYSEIPRLGCQKARLHRTSGHEDLRTRSARVSETVCETY